MRRVLLLLSLLVALRAAEAPASLAYGENLRAWRAIEAELARSPDDQRLLGAAVTVLWRMSLLGDPSYRGVAMPWFSRARELAAQRATLRGGRTATAEELLPELWVLAIDGRTAAAVAALDAAGGGDAPGVRALRCWCTRDWRPLRGRDDLAPEERLALVRALMAARMFSAARAVRFAPGTAPALAHASLLRRDGRVEGLARRALAGALSDDADEHLDPAALPAAWTAAWAAGDDPAARVRRQRLAQSAAQTAWDDLRGGGEPVVGAAAVDAVAGEPLATIVAAYGGRPIAPAALVAAITALIDADPSLALLAGVVSQAADSEAPGRDELLARLLVWWERWRGGGHGGIEMVVAIAREYRQVPALRAELRAASAADPWHSGLPELLEVLECADHGLPEVDDLPPLASWDEAAIDHDAGGGAWPGVGLSDSFHIRWQGRLRVPRDGFYRFVLRSDDGSRLDIGGRRVATNGWTHGAVDETGVIALAAGEAELVLDYFEATGGAMCRLSWQPPGADGVVPVPTEAFVGLRATARALPMARLPMVRTHIHAAAAIEVPPWDLHGRLRAARALAQAKRHEEAVEACRAILALDPAHDGTAHLVADLLGRLGRTAERDAADDAYLAAADAHVCRACHLERVLERELAAGRPQAAEALARKLAAEDASAARLLARLLDRLGRHREAAAERLALAKHGEGRRDAGPDRWHAAADLAGDPTAAAEAAALVQGQPRPRDTAVVERLVPRLRRGGAAREAVATVRGQRGDPLPLRLQLAAARFESGDLTGAQEDLARILGDGGIVRVPGRLTVEAHLLLLACCRATASPPPAPEAAERVFASGAAEPIERLAWRLLRRDLAPAEADAQAVGLDAAAWEYWRAIDALAENDREQARQRLERVAASAAAPAGAARSLLRWLADDPPPVPQSRRARAPAPLPGPERHHDAGAAPTR